MQICQEQVKGFAHGRQNILIANNNLHLRAIKYLKMKSFYSFVTFVLMISTLISCKRNEIPDTGVSHQLANERVAIIDSLSYNLFFDIPYSADQEILAKNIISFYLKNKSSHIILDFKESPEKIKNVKVGPYEIEYQAINEHIIIPGEYLVNGKNEIQLEFIAGDLSLNRQDEYLYTLFVPDRARTAFPCFDQPDLKANFNLTLEVPSEWIAVANGEEEDILENGNRKTYRFSRTKKLPTYLFAFVAGKFKIEERSSGGRTVKLFHRETRDENYKHNTDEIFRQVYASLEWMEKYTDIPYPFAKYELVAIPSFQYGGMEHTGATLYRAERIFLPKSPTQDQLLSRANLIAHETAHMWFGDLVTMEWFNEVWLKEVFANFIAEKITNPWFESVNHDLKFLVAHYPAAYEIDRTKGANPVQQKLDNLEDAGTIYGAIIYHKAPIVMRKLEKITGEKEMQDGLREYLVSHSYGNATWDDLISILDNKTPVDLKKWSKVWVEVSGMAEYILETVDESLLIRQTDPQERGRIWEDRFFILSKMDKIEIGIATEDTVIITDPDFPAYINSNGMGYGYFRIPDPVNYLNFFLAEYNSLDDLNKTSQWLILYENLLHGRMNAKYLLAGINSILTVEENQLVLQEVLRIQKILYWKFLQDDERLMFEPEITSLLWKLVSDNPGKTAKSAFNQIVDISLSGENLQKIHTLWKEGGNDIISLSTKELLNISYELMLKMPGNYHSISEFEKSRLKNQDDSTEFIFESRALNPDRAERQLFFLELEDPVNREREAWVLTAVHYLNHPLRQQEEIKNLYHYLELVPEIKETGDIFFPKRWMDAVLWGHNSKEAAMIVESFIKENPGFPPSLLNKLYQSADLLFRAIE